MHTRVRFVEGQHPDVRMEVAIPAGRLDFPIECKRINPGNQQGPDDFVQLLDEQLVSQGDIPPLKLMVVIHERIAKSAIPDLVEGILSTARELLPHASEGSWATASTPDGRFQVVLSPLGSLGEFRNEAIEITDVPADSAMRVRCEIKHLGTPSDPRRMRSVVRVRNDWQHSRVGNLEQRMNEAVAQLRLSTGDDELG